MRLIAWVIKTVLILCGLIFITIVTTFLFAFGGLVYLLGGGRKPAFRVYSYRGGGRGGYPEGFEQRPMKDVTPKPTGQQLNSASDV